MKTYEIWYVPFKSNYTRLVAYVEATDYAIALMKFEMKYSGKYAGIFSCAPGETYR